MAYDCKRYDPSVHDFNGGARLYVCESHKTGHEVLKALHMAVPDLSSTVAVNSGLDVFRTRVVL